MPPLLICLEWSSVHSCEILGKILSDFCACGPPVATAFLEGSQPFTMDGKRKMRASANGSYNDYVDDYDDQVRADLPWRPACAW